MRYLKFKKAVIFKGIKVSYLIFFAKYSFLRKLSLMVKRMIILISTKRKKENANHRVLIAFALEDRSVR
jgi:hypothetical protein